MISRSLVNRVMESTPIFIGDICIISPLKGIYKITADAMYRKLRAHISEKRNPITPNCERLVAYNNQGELEEIETIRDGEEKYLLEKRKIPAFRPFPFASPKDRTIVGVRGKIIHEGEIYAWNPMKNLDATFLTGGYQNGHYFDYEETKEDDPVLSKIKNSFTSKKD